MYVLRQKSRLEAALRQQKCCLGLTATFWCLALVSMSMPRPRSHLFCLASTRGIRTCKLSYDIIINNFHPFIFSRCVSYIKTKLHLFIKQRFQMQAKRVRYVLRHEFSLLFKLRVSLLTWFSDGLASASNILPLPKQPASALPRLDLILSCLALLRPWPRQICLGLSLSLVKTASSTSLQITVKYPGIIPIVSNFECLIGIGEF